MYNVRYFNIFRDSLEREISEESSRQCTSVFWNATHRLLFTPESSFSENAELLKAIRDDLHAHVV